VIQAWENDNYSGRSIIIKYLPIIALPTEKIIGTTYNLKKTPCGSGNWNDRITSVLAYQEGSRPTGFPL